MRSIQRGKGWLRINEHIILFKYQSVCLNHGFIFKLMEVKNLKNGFNFLNLYLEFNFHIFKIKVQYLRSLPKAPVPVLFAGGSPGRPEPRWVPATRFGAEGRLLVYGCRGQLQYRRTQYNPPYVTVQLAIKKGAFFILQGQTIHS